MTDDPRRRHLTPEEAAELRRRARERRGYADPGREAPRDPRPEPPRRDRPVGRTGYQPRQEPEPWSERGRAGDPRGRDPRARDPRARSGARDPYREPVDRRADPAAARGRGERRHRDDRRGRDDRRPPLGAGAAAAAPRARRAPRERRTRRRIGPLRIIGLLLAVLLTLGVVTVLWADSQLQRIDALTGYEGRGGRTPGTVTLLVGTDSREGLTAEQQAQLSTGSESDAGGKRTDTMMLVYTPRGDGRTMLISLPRDLLVTIPGYGENKLNAAYTYGGAPLLVRTLEEQSGVRIDHYAEIGFGGFAGIVDAVGGVDVCVDQQMDDPLAGINLAPGCQTLTGPQALGFVRSRYGFAEQDLQRVRNQRQFLGSLMRKTLAPGNLLNPFTALPLLDATSAAVTVDTGDHLWNLLSVMWKVRDDPLTVTTPYDGMDSGAVGSYLVWGPSTTAFFDALAAGRTPPEELLETGG